jgi:hypothetical protein
MKMRVLAIAAIAALSFNMVKGPRCPKPAKAIPEEGVFTR